MMKKASTWNGITLPENFQKLFSSTKPTVNRRVSVFDLFQKGYRRTTSLMAIIWFSIILLYFGITLHMGSLGGNIYLNVVCKNYLYLRDFLINLELQVIAGTVEAVSIAASVFVVLRLGLRINLVVYLLIAGIACIMINYARADNLWLTISLAMIGK